MVSPPLLFAGVPGGIELLVVFFVVFLLFGLPLTLIVALAYRHLKNATDLEKNERLDQLESDVAELRAQLESGEGSTAKQAGLDAGESPDRRDGGSR